MQPSAENVSLQQVACIQFKGSLLQSWFKSQYFRIWPKELAVLTKYTGD